MELQNLFSTVLNMTVTGSVVTLCVLLARLVLRRAPRVYSYALWAVVLFRLLCPVSVSAPVSVLTVVDAPEPKGQVGMVEYVEAPVQAPLETMHVEEIHAQEPAPTNSAPVAEPIDWNLIAARVWAVGVAVLAVYGILSYVNLKRKLREAAPIGKGLREADGIQTPFVLGFFRPVIYLPSRLGEQERGYVLLHEQYHIRHGDHLVKAAFWLAACLHWFNPLVWVASSLCTRDMEMRCDEAVLKALGPQVRSDYAQSLLNLAAGRRMVPAPLAFGEGDTGKRVKHVLGWKRKALWVGIPAAVLCAVVLIVAAVNPGGSLFDESPFGHSYKAATVSPSQSEESVNQTFTLTSDMALFIRDSQNTSMRGSFKKLSRLPDTCAAYSDPEAWAQMKGETERAWEAIQNGSDHYLLLQQKDGSLYLIQGETVYLLERVDLLGVSIKQPGTEHYVEPVWYRADSPDWYSGSLSTTLVDGEAEVVLIPEIDVDTILVTEEYHDGNGSVTVYDYFLTKNANGEFSFTAERRGDEGDYYAIYRVTVGEEQYMFRLTFPAVPGVTSVAGVPEEEQTREVSFSEGGAYITLQIPESWECTVTSFVENENAAGITFWPRGREEGKLRFEYYPDMFAVCGTGLTSTTMTVAGQTASVGTYDDNFLWTFLGFGEHFAVWGEDHESWWAEYGETAMEILDTAQFGEYVDMEAVRGYFRNYRLHEDAGPGEVLLGEKDYQAVYYPQREEVLLCEYAAAGTEVEVLNAWSGRVYDDVCISVSCLEREGEYVYFGYLRSEQDGVSLADGTFHFLLEDGWVIDMILNEFKGFCFVCDSPMEDFELRTESGTLVLNLAGYLSRGCEVTEAEGKIVLNEPEGEAIICTLPVSPTEP